MPLIQYSSVSMACLSLKFVLDLVSFLFNYCELILTLVIVFTVN